MTKTIDFDKHFAQYTRAWYQKNQNKYKNVDEMEAMMPEIYQQWLEGPKTEDNFAELARLFTDDSNADQGGLYEDIFPGQMVDSFNHWCFDGRKPGDHGLIQTEYGWHVVYYCGDSGITYRDYMVSRDKLTADTDAWYEALISSVSCEVLNTGFVNKEYIIEPNQIK